MEYILSKSDTYTQFRRYRKPKFPPIKVYKQYELFKMDLIFVTDKGMAEENDGFQYAICVIDCFTKYAGLHNHGNTGNTLPATSQIWQPHWAGPKAQPASQT